MKNNISTIYVCSNCDAQFPKWSGRCLECGAWGSLQMQTVDQKSIEQKSLNVSPAKILDLDRVENKNKARIKTNISEIDRVLGGGLIPGSLILLGGEPGIGKSTIVAQIAGIINTNSPIIYVSGEESINQIKDRLDRIKANTQNIKFITDTNIEKILAGIKEVKPSLVIIDSIQTVYTSILPSESGSINQIRAAAVKFLEYAKNSNTAIILIGHITKDGQVAGPKSLEHIVDTVIYLETETAHNYLILRATKNRFGSINEIGIFEMTSAGFKEITNPGSVFINEQEEKISGSVISCIIEGTRPFLVEIQALVSKTVFGYPQRKAAGFDFNRLQILCAVLTKRTKINLTNQDVIVNIVGGLKINDPALDLSICYAIATSLLNQAVDRKTIILGEVGLGGEIRNVAKLEQRLNEAKKLGFTKAIIPSTEVKIENINLEKVKNLTKIVERVTHKHNI